MVKTLASMIPEERITRELGLPLFKPLGQGLGLGQEQLARVHFDQPLPEHGLASGLNAGPDAGGKIDPGQTAAEVGVPIQGSQKIVPLGVEVDILHHGARGQHPGHFAFDQPLGLLRVLDLIAQRHLVALVQQLAKIFVDGVMRHPAHGHGILRTGVAAGERDLKLPGSDLGVFEKKLEKISHAEEHEGARILSLDPQVLLHHGRDLYRVHDASSLRSWRMIMECQDMHFGQQKKIWPRFRPQRPQTKRFASRARRSRNSSWNSNTAVICCSGRDMVRSSSRAGQKVFRKNEPLRFSNIKLRDMDAVKIVDLRILPLPQKKGQEPLVAVFLEEVARPDILDKTQGIQAYDLSLEAEQRINDLEQELQFTRENLQATVEELETANEELQATNEELLASNEELQSTNEELQSTNEELYSVNSEYQSKIVELSELHNDVDNLLNVSQIGQLLLDENMDIRRFSPKVADVFNVLGTDVGRSLQDISHQLENADPVRIIESVHRLGKMTEHEVRAKDGRWYLMRVVPYSVGPKVFSGTLVSFVDITRLRLGEEALRASEEEFRALFETLPLGVVYHAADGSIVSANPAAARILGLTLDQMLGKTSMDPRWKMIREDGSSVSGKHHPSMIALLTGRKEGPVVRGVFHPEKNAHIWLSITAMPLVKPGEDTPSQVYATFEDITEKRQAEQDFQALFREMFNGFSLHEIICDENGKPVDYRFLAVNPAFERLTGLRGDEILGRTVLEILPGTEHDWIESCGRVALTGNHAKFEHYSPDLGKNFQVTVFRPVLGQFACIFAEIECPEVTADPALDRNS